MRWDFNDFLCFMFFFTSRNLSATLGALQSQNCINQVKIGAVYSNSLIQDNIIRYKLKFSNENEFFRHLCCWQQCAVMTLTGAFGVESII
jgi:hypothetical protein